MYRTKQQPRKGDHYDVIQEYMHRCGLKQTQQRKTILTVFLEMKDHPTPEEIYDEILRRGHKLGLATIYRTLKVLVEAGIVRKLEFGDGQARYEWHDTRDQHLHMVCTQCGRTYDAPAADMDLMFKELVKPYTFKIQSYATNLYGLCDQCLPTGQSSKTTLK